MSSMHVISSWPLSRMASMAPAARFMHLLEVSLVLSKLQLPGLELILCELSPWAFVGTLSSMRVARCPSIQRRTLLLSREWQPWVLQPCG